MQKSRRFHELLREAREKARQSTEVMGILLNMDEEDYIAIERGDTFPDNETLKRLCMMLEWNYYDSQRMVINEIATRPGGATPGGEAAIRALQSVPMTGAQSATGSHETLGARLRKVRETTGQTVDIIAMLLNIPPALYRRVESGEAPGDDLLRRISMVYDWNYYDLQAVLRMEQARTLQPHRIGSPYPGASAHSLRLRPLLHEIETLFAALPEREQQMALAQLELIRELLRKSRHAS
jgi:transcriptional regulator with XRE-family HTH domain